MTASFSAQEYDIVQRDKFSHYPVLFWTNEICYVQVDNYCFFYYHLFWAVPGVSFLVRDL